MQRLMIPFEKWIDFDLQMNLEIRPMKMRRDGSCITFRLRSTFFRPAGIRVDLIDGVKRSGVDDRGGVHGVASNAKTGNPVGLEIPCGVIIGELNPAVIWGVDRVNRGNGESMANELMLRSSLLESSPP